VSVIENEYFFQIQSELESFQQISMQIDLQQRFLVETFKVVSSVVICFTEYVMKNTFPLYKTNHLEQPLQQ